MLKPKRSLSSCWEDKMISMAHSRAIPLCWGGVGEQGWAAGMNVKVGIHGGEA